MYLDKTDDRVEKINTKYVFQETTQTTLCNIYHLKYPIFTNTHS